MSRINPEDKRRFGEDSTPLVEENAKAAAREVGLPLAVERRRISFGGVVVEYSDGQIKAEGLRAPADWETWRIFKTLFLSFVANNRRPPDERELRELLFAATGA